ncbi:LacI family DNA-binding transcriptional regulator [Bifidobacterium tsurumiense]|uniref:Periplasmic-binding protein/LacI transcriptional regulator n=1 Tax=Bifidobacterium tsurumiense TaxID=356829 RepID=A0A087EKL6_9BIFI|nr:LacI family DNA-binding transcriptional regulator [Bifidobacterium tsurumiense]KFJ08317.1 periplasmic-binding protein/LacI transcriptional regulator [Bifidobacterium tsurumiense]MDY4677714.1 LacI family DNA-binding transcriptional regulator [Bifidobacterium tsurumiense]MSS12225.1 LacI family transcriptional regulator [Bifidobacterium tsurumiense]
MHNSYQQISEPNNSVRLSDIAEATGFSLSTVSKALNGRSDVAESTRRIINAALNMKGYTKRNTARKKQHLIEVVFQDFDNIWALEVLRGVVKEAKKHDLGTITTISGDKKHPDNTWIDGVIHRQPVGVILIFSTITNEEQERLNSCGIPFVIFDPSGNPTLNSMSVQADNWTGGLTATRHLLSLGHTRIGIITGPSDMMCSRARFDGYATALAERGIDIDPALVTEGEFTTPGGYAQAMELLNDPLTRPTAIFAGSDLQAMGVYEAARQFELSIPNQLSVIGFDDIQTSEFLGPALTTIRQPLQDMASAATELIVKTINKLPAQRHIIMPTSLVLRQSTQALHPRERRTDP